MPRELRRHLFRLSALFELADEQFSELRDSGDWAEFIAKAGTWHGRKARSRAGA